MISSVLRTVLQSNNQNGGQHRHSVVLPFFPLLLVQERLLALKRSMSFMQDMDYTQQAAILGDEDLTADIPAPDVIPLPTESAKKSKKQPVKVMKEVIRYP